MAGRSAVQCVGGACALFLLVSFTRCTWQPSRTASARARPDLRIEVKEGVLEIAAEKPNFGLVNGTSAETSGGLLVMLPESVVDAFIKDVKQGDGEDAWRVGVVISANSLAERDAFFAPDVNFFEV